MVKIKLSDLLGKHKMNQKKLSELTGIRPGTISQLYYEKAKRLDLKHLDEICKVFSCTLNELIEYIPEEN